MGAARFLAITTGVIVLVGCARARNDSRVGPDGVEDITLPARGGLVPRFAWPAMTLDLETVSEHAGVDGVVTQDERVRGSIVVAARVGGGVDISFSEAAPPPGASPLDRAISRAYGLMHVLTRADGQIERLGGVGAFFAAVKADPEAAAGIDAWLRAPGLAAFIEASVEQDYVVWIVTWLDLGWVPEPGRKVRWRVGSVVVTMSSQDLSHEAAGRVKLTVRIEGPAPQISVHRTFLTGLVPNDRYDASSGFQQVELVTDPRDLIPVRAVVEKELAAGAGPDRVRGWARTTTTFRWR